MVNAVPRARVAGGAPTMVSTRSGRVTVTMGAAEATQLLASSLSATLLASSAHARRKYVLSGADAGIVTVTVPVLVPSLVSAGMGSMAGTWRLPVSWTSPAPFAASRDR